MDYTLNKYDFRDYLLAQLHDARQDQLVFWKSNMPLPIDLIYDIFEKRAGLFSKYIDHIGAIYLLCYCQRDLGESWKTSPLNQPDTKTNDEKLELSQLFTAALSGSGVNNLLLSISEKLLLNDYQLSVQALILAISHKGKKYNRLYLPKIVKDLIRESFPELIVPISGGKTDFFANEVADELGIYRSGFGDVLIAVFNKLIDFILENQISSRKAQPVYLTGLKKSIDLHHPEANSPVAYASIVDGSIWEPVFIGSDSSFTLNKNHPFSIVFKEGNKYEILLTQLLRIMSKIEDETFKVSEKKQLERFRQDVSRELRLWLESEL